VVKGNAREEVKMALALGGVYFQAEGTRELEDVREPLPEVDADSFDLDDLFAWGSAVTRRGQITPKRSRQIVIAVRKHVKSGP